MSDLSLAYTVEHNGRALKSGRIGELNVAPESECVYGIDVPKISSGVVTLNVYVKQNTETEWAKIGHDIATYQFILLDSPEKKTPVLLGADVVEDFSSITVNYGEVSAKISRVSGLITSLVNEGKEMLSEPVVPTIWRAPTDNDRKVKHGWMVNDYHRLSVKCYSVNCEKLSDRVVVTSEVSLGSPAKKPVVKMTLKYTFAAGAPIGVECNATVRDDAPAIPRFGFKFVLPEHFEDVKYFGYGPYESYEDKRLASRLSLFRTTATDNFEPYVRPQENSAHYGCKWATVSSTAGHGIFFGADKFSFSVSHFDPNYLTDTAHNYELVPQKETTVIIDYRNAGIGSNSCGPELLPEYRISEKEISFSFSFSPEFIGNIDPFSKYEKI